MKTDLLRAARRSNLRVALEAPDVVKKDLGISMGWADGSFIGQMIVGKRPVTEELARQLEEKLGIPEGSLDLPPKAFMLMNPKASTPELREARNVAAVLTAMAEVVRANGTPPEPRKVGQAAAFLTEQARNLGALSGAQVRNILGKMLVI